MAVAGAVALGLMQLGVPVASAASVPKAPPIVAAAKARLVAADVSSAQVTAGVLGPRVGAAESRADFSYDMSFVITRKVTVSQAEFFRLVRFDFTKVFPIPGARPLRLGANMDLRPAPGALFNVRVATLVSNGWTFGTRLGHPDFPNGYIAFRFVRVASTMLLKVHAFIPLTSAGGACFAHLVCHEVYMNRAANAWSRFAVSLTRFWNGSWSAV